MIDVTPRARRLVDAYRKEAPALEWCVLIAWAGSEADNYRSSDGSQVWTQSIPRGWTVGISTYSPELADRYVFTEVSGVKVGVESNPHAMVACSATQVDADGIEFCLVP